MSIRQLTSEIASLNKDIANLQEKYAKEKKLESDKKLKIISIQKTITKSTSASMLTAKQKQIAALRNELEKACGITQWSLNDSAENMKKAGQYLSYYALRDNWEFIAEAVAEYMGGSPRETARKVMDILLRKD